MRYLKFLFIVMVVKSIHVFSIEDNLNYATVQIKTVSGSGTGFLFQFPIPGRSEQIPAIITNKHVKGDSTAGSIVFHIQDEAGEAKSLMECEISGSLWRWIDHPGDVDLSALLLAPIMEEMDSKGVRPFYRFLSSANIITQEQLDRLFSVNNIIMVGYPIGLIDHTRNFPIFRQGITATHPGLSFKGKAEFLIDSACWPGSSGSPVFMSPCMVKTRGITYIDGGDFGYKLLGVLWGGPQYTATGDIVPVEIPMTKAPVSLTSLPTNLGFVIHAREILEIGVEILRSFQPAAVSLSDGLEEPPAEEGVAGAGSAAPSASEGGPETSVISATYGNGFSGVRRLVGEGLRLIPSGLIKFERGDLTGIPRLCLSTERKDLIEKRTWESFAEAAKDLIKRESPSLLKLSTIAFNLLEVINETAKPLMITIIGSEETKEIDQVVEREQKKLFYLDLETLYDPYMVRGTLAARGTFSDLGVVNTAASASITLDQSYVKLIFTTFLTKLNVRTGSLMGV